MPAPLHIDAALVTEALLMQHLKGEREISLPDGAIITPSARDYLRLHRVTVVNRSSGTVPRPRSSAAADMGTPIQEVLPPGAEGGMLYQGRCDHPDRSFGCHTEEFGSGFVQPACCAACAAKGSNGGPGCDCDGCNQRSDEASFEALVQQLTDEIMARLTA